MNFVTVCMHEGGPTFKDLHPSHKISWLRRIRWIIHELHTNVYFLTHFLYKLLDSTSSFYSNKTTLGYTSSSFSWTVNILFVYLPLKINNRDSFLYLTEDTRRKFVSYSTVESPYNVFSKINPSIWSTWSIWF